MHKSCIVVARSFKFDLAKGSKIHADKGYTDYQFEDHLELEQDDIISEQRDKVNYFVNLLLLLCEMAKKTDIFISA